MKNIAIVYNSSIKMEASASEGNTNSEEAFKTCGRTGRRGACIDTDIEGNKLQEIIHKVEKVSLDASESAQPNQGENKT